MHAAWRGNRHRSDGQNSPICTKTDRARLAATEVRYFGRLEKRYGTALLIFKMSIGTDARSVPFYEAFLPSRIVHHGVVRAHLSLYTSQSVVFCHFQIVAALQIHP